MRKRNHLLTIGAVIAISTILLACKEEIPNELPVCSIVNPSEGQTFEVGDSVDIAIEANDTDGNIEHLEIKMDGALFNQFYKKPFEFTWFTKLIHEGEHTLTAIATDDAGGTTVDEISFSIENRRALPTASFEVSDTIIAVGETVFFTDKSGNEPNSWLWDFGDGAMSDERNPAHNYSAPGKYTVVLIVTNRYGDDIETKENCIDAGLIPVADFSIVDSMAGVGLEIQFWDLSLNDPIQYLWSFGDGTHSTDKDPRKVYHSTGTYDITLWVSNLYGENELVKPGELTIGLAPVAKFSASSTEITVGTRVVFTDESENDPLYWYWDFGDGSASTAQHPAHTYSESGTYDVSLKVESLLGSDSLMIPGYIVVNPQ